MSSISDIKNEIIKDLKKKDIENNQLNNEEIYINQLQSFEENPFKLCSNEEIEELAESIKDEGLLNPIILWKKENDYIILSGHNRIEALKKLGYEKLTRNMYKIKENISLEDARLILVDTNLVQRKEILPSERAKAYKIQQSVLYNKDTNRNVKILFQNVLDTGEMAEDENLLHGETNRKILESRTTIFRYLRLNNLINQLLNEVDKGELTLKMGVELSYLTENEQEEVYIYFFVDKIGKINLELCKLIRKESKRTPINVETLGIIEEKNKKKIIKKKNAKIDIKDIEKIIDKKFNNNEQARQYIINCIKFYEENKRE